MRKRHRTDPPRQVTSLERMKVSVNHITLRPRPCWPISANVQYSACTLPSARPGRACSMATELMYQTLTLPAPSSCSIIRSRSNGPWRQARLSKRCFRARFTDRRELLRVAQIVDLLQQAGQTALEHRTCGQAWPAQPFTSPCVQGCARQPLRRERSGKRT